VHDYKKGLLYMHVGGGGGTHTQFIINKPIP
jgi:hypothetical protein